MSKLGFADQDKRDRRHDWACEYLAGPARTAVVARAVFPAEPQEVDRVTHVIRRYRGRETVKINAIRSEIEKPIVRGKSMAVGFADVVLTCEVEAKFVGQTREETIYQNGPFSQEKFGPWKDEACPVFGNRSIVIEIKISPVGTGDLLRQVNLYRVHWPESQPFDNHCNLIRRYVVATAYPLARTDVDQLAAAGITHVYLGREFRRFVIEHELAAWEPQENASLEL